MRPPEVNKGGIVSQFTGQLPADHSEILKLCRTKRKEHYERYGDKKKKKKENWAGRERKGRR